MNGVKVKINPDKTEFIIIDHTRPGESVIPKFLVTFIQSSIMLSESKKT